MRNVPVDMSRVASARCVTVPEAKTVYGTGEVVVDRRTGLRVWLVGVAMRKADERKATVIEINVNAAEAPAVAEGDLVAITGLETALWERDGRAGLTFRAESVTSAATPVAGSAAPSVPASATGSAPAASVAGRSGKGGE